MSKRTVLAGLAAAAVFAAPPLAVAGAEEKTPAPEVKRKERVVVIKEPGARGDAVRDFLVVGPDGEKHLTGKFAGWNVAGPSGYIGVALVDLTPELRRHFGAGEEAGVMISRVEEGSPAAKVGVQVGDILVAVDGEKVETAWDVRLAIRQKKKDDAAKLELWREGRALTLSATVAESKAPQVDLGPLMLWEGEGGERIPLPEIDTARIEEMTRKLQEHQFQLEESNAKELERKMKELEQKLQEMERKLREKSSLMQPKPVS
jgi:membrane-associated protease RseP (regulator of RpoE activity)